MGPRSPDTFDRYSMRRILLILLLLAIAGATTWTLLNWNTVVRGSLDPWQSVPQRAAVIIEVPDAWQTWERFTHTSQLWGAIEQLPAMSAMGRLMARTMERMENDAALKSALADVPVLISITRTGGDVVDVLFVCVPKSSNGVPMQAFAELLNGNEATVAALSKGEIVQVRPDTSYSEFSLTVQNGIWLLATSPAMMDEALLQLKTDRSQTDTLLLAARRTLGAGSQSHVLVHTDRAKALLNSWWSPGTVEDLDIPSGWIAMDLETRADAVLLSGLLLPSEDHGTVRTITGQGAGRNDLSRWLPAEVCTWSAEHVEDAELFLRDLGIATGSDISVLGPALFNWVHGTIGHGRGLPTTAGPSPHWFFFSTDDTELAVEALTADPPEGGFDTIAYRGKRITQLDLANGHSKLLGPAYAELERPWWCMLGNMAVFASEPGLLRAAVDAWIDGRTLAEDVRTSAWTQRIASNTGLDLRCDLARCWTAFGVGMKPGPSAEYAKQAEFMQQFGGVSIQLSPARHGQLNIAVGLQLAPLEERVSGELWSTLVGPVSRKPDLVRNHTNGTQEVMVQDNLHRLHLIGSTGKLLWSRNLEGSILGEVHQVDRFRNGKLQYLFNTAERLYVIDRNGKDVGDLPVKFPSLATAPLAVFDYDDQRDYRVLLPISDGRILNYGIDGAPVKGWEPQRLKVASGNPVHHIRIKNKDYLLIADGNGSIVLLDRRGEERGTSELDLGPSPELLAVWPSVDLMGTSLIWTDTTGRVNRATLGGTRAVLSEQRNGSTFLGTVGSDGEMDLVHISSDTITVHHGGKRIFMRSFGTSLAPTSDIYHFGAGNSAYGLVQPERDLVTLVNSSGEEMEGMPVQGATRFSIGDLNLDGQLELITVTNDGHIVAHRLPFTSNSGR